MNKTRVKYNFAWKLPTGHFTMKQLMSANSGVSYITLYMRLQRAIVGKTIKKLVKTQETGARGCPQKMYVFVPKRSHKKKVQPAVTALVTAPATV